MNYFYTSSPPLKFLIALSLATVTIGQPSLSFGHAPMGTEKPAADITVSGRVTDAATRPVDLTAPHRIMDRAAARRRQASLVAAAGRSGTMRERMGGDAGRAWRTRAAAPATCGADAEVPDHSR